MSAPRALCTRAQTATRSAYSELLRRLGASGPADSAGLGPGVAASSTGQVHNLAFQEAGWRRCGWQAQHRLPGGPGRATDTTSVTGTQKQVPPGNTTASGTHVGEDLLSMTFPVWTRPVLGMRGGRKRPKPFVPNAGGGCVGGCGAGVWLATLGCPRGRQIGLGLLFLQPEIF